MLNQDSIRMDSAPFVNCILAKSKHEVTLREHRKSH
jgi:hypothetical protein